MSKAVVADAVVKYPAHSGLRASLVEAVRSYFERRNIRPDGGWRMVLKSVLFLAWWLTAFSLLVFWASTWWHVVLLTVAVGLSVAGIGFNIQHDGGHGSYARRPFANRVSALALDLMGGSSYFWHFKHNILHHQYTNVEGVDDDLDAGPFLRLASGQQRRWFHRFQHWYIWPLYAFLPPRWQFWDDFATLAKGRIGTHRIPRPKGWNLALLFAGKAAFVTWALVVPLTMHSVGIVLLVYAGCVLVTGVTLGTVFQLAHCIQGASFRATPKEGERMDRPWTEHQLATTVDFAPRNRLLSWYLGGLNFQVEHHLFPRVSHIHYPALEPIIRSICLEHDVPHLSYDTLWSAMRAHVRHLRMLGRPA